MNSILLPYVIYVYIFVIGAMLIQMNLTMDTMRSVHHLLRDSCRRVDECLMQLMRKLICHKRQTGQWRMSMLKWTSRRRPRRSRGRYNLHFLALSCFLDRMFVWVIKPFVLSGTHFVLALKPSVSLLLVLSLKGPTSSQIPSFVRRA